MTGEESEVERDTGAGWLIERRIYIRSDRGTRSFALSGRAQALMGVAVAGVLAWSAVATASMLLDVAGATETQAEASAVQASYAARLKHLTAERDRTDAALATHNQTLDDINRKLAEQHAALRESERVRSELSKTLALIETKLSDAIEEREQVSAAHAALERRIEDGHLDASAVAEAERELSATLAAVNAALSDAVAARDDALRDADAAQAKMAQIETEQVAAADRRERMYAQLEEAVRFGLDQMEIVFDRAGLDVDDLVASVKQEYSGAGGPFIPVAAVGGRDAAFEAAGDPDAQRVDALIGGLERLSLMQVAAAKLPLAEPVRSAYRLTSGFGVRRDPKNGRARMHKGLDFAASRGTPIHTTGDGVVTFAGWQSGYGRVVKIRHSFGFETVYAHLHQIRIKAGDRIARGERVGDMGSSGRSTGTHLHYEIRVNGKAINPSKYIEAARNVL